MNQDEITGAILFFVIVVVCAVFIRRAVLVGRHSQVLKELAMVNASFASRIGLGPMTLLFTDSLGSKSQLDRLNLRAAMLGHLAPVAPQLRSQIRARTDQQGAMVEYETRRRDLEQRLGASPECRLRPRTFARIERRRFNRRRLHVKPPSAQIRFIASYTSPGGRNSYQREIQLDFGQLDAALQEIAAQSAQRSSVQAMRAQERSRMTPRLRSTILKRDGYRCRHCGRSAADQVVLHVDHIIPIAKGGRSDASNLQALCADCNLGKSHVL